MVRNSRFDQVNVGLGLYYLQFMYQPILLWYYLISLLLCQTWSWWSGSGNMILYLRRKFLIIWEVKNDYLQAINQRE